MPAWAKDRGPHSAIRIPFSVPLSGRRDFNAIKVLLTPVPPQRDWPAQLGKKMCFFFFFPDISYLTGRCWKAGNFQLPVGKNKKKSGGKKSQTKPNTNQWVDSSQQENMREFLFCFVFPLESETPSTISRAR